MSVGTCRKACCKGLSAISREIVALLLQAINNEKMQLRSLQSEALEIPEQVEVEAELAGQERDDAFLERIVGRFSLEPEVSAVKWKIIEQEYG